MQKKNQNKTIKQIVLFIILVIIVLLIIFAKDILKLHNKNRLLEDNIELAKANYVTTIAENDYPIDNAVTDTPNLPIISAGMIPVKWDGTYWVITTADDENWYDYANGKPAYVMLNDGTYQSELIRDMTNKKLANENIGTQIRTSELGTICLWCPRFAYNNAGEILYIKQCYKVVGTWNVPEIFTYVTTKMDFSLAGVWIENKDVAFQATRVNEMNSEEGKYGFIANTKASVIEANDRIELQKYITYIRNQKNNETGNNEQISDININLERAIIKITNAEKREAIKANAKYSNEKIIVTVEYSENGISEIIDVVNKQKLELKEGSLVADTGNTPIGNCIYEFVIIDKLGIQRKVEVTVSGLDVYIIRDKATLYAFRDAVNAGLTSATTKAYQVADVSVPSTEQWTPIADYATNSKLTFAGIYDGQNHTVSGININHSSGSNRVGFFGTVSGTVKNVGITNSTIKNTSSISASTNPTGSLIARLESGGKLDNCYSTATVSGKGYSGGLVGVVDTDGGVTISKCYNSGYINGSNSYIGGIVGYKEGKGTITITSSYNKGTVIASSSTNNYIGGIIGRIDNTDTSDKIINCYNIGNITGQDSVGGIVGYVPRGTSNTCVNIQNCYNAGLITGESEVGGISGTCGSATNCYNIGNIIGQSRVGGIVGENGVNGGTNGVTVIGDNITSCFNTGKITGTANTVGGICGRAAGSSGDTKIIRVTDCYNTGAVSGAQYVGGISGDSDRNCVFTRTYNTGEVSGTSTNVGGIVGNIGGSTTGTKPTYSLVSCSYNIGIIGTSSDRVGGIAGYNVCSSSVNTIVKSVNAGKVNGKSGSNNIGAVTGYHSNSSYSGIEGCVYLSGTATYAAGGSKLLNGGSTTCETIESIKPQIITICGSEYFKTDIGINNGFPVLKWQTTNDRLNLINGGNAFKQAEDGTIILSWQNLET